MRAMIHHVTGCCFSLLFGTEEGFNDLHYYLIVS